MGEAGSSQILCEGKYLRLSSCEGWEYCQRTTGDAVVTVVAVTQAGALIVNEQYRAPLDGPVLELPAGLVGDHDDSESAVTAAARELEEETGYRAQRLVRVTAGPTSAGLTSEVIDFFIAEGLERVGEGGGTESENITVHEVPIDDAFHWLERRRAAGVAVDPKIYAGLYLYANAKR